MNIVDTNSLISNSINYEQLNFNELLVSLFNIKYTIYDNVNDDKIEKDLLLTSSRYQLIITYKSDNDISMGSEENIGTINIIDYDNKIYTLNINHQIESDKHQHHNLTQVLELDKYIKQTIDISIEKKILDLNKNNTSNLTISEISKYICFKNEYNISEFNSYIKSSSYNTNINELRDELKEFLDRYHNKFYIIYDSQDIECQQYNATLLEVKKQESSKNLEFLDLEIINDGSLEEKIQIEMPLIDSDSTLNNQIKINC